MTDNDFTHRWERQAHETVQAESHEQPVASLFLAMMAEMGDIAGALDEAAGEFPPDEARGLIPRTRRFINDMKRLGQDAGEYLEANRVHPALHHVVGEVDDPSPILDELHDLGPLCFMLLWAVESGEPLTDGGGHPYEVGIQAFTHEKVIAPDDETAEERALEQADVPRGWDVSEVNPTRLTTDGGYETQTWRGTAYPAPDDWTVKNVEADGIYWERPGQTAMLTNHVSDTELSVEHKLEIDGDEVLSLTVGPDETPDIWDHVADALNEHREDAATPRGQAAEFWNRYSIPFAHDVAIKGRRSGLTRGSAGDGRAKNTVIHLWVQERFSEGRLSRQPDTYLCDPDATPSFEFTEERHTDEQGEYRPAVTCESCLGLMERWLAEDPEVVTDGGERCFCQGENPEWKYHHPTGCADTAQAFVFVAEVPTTEAWDEPRPPKTGGVSTDLRTDGGEEPSGVSYTLTDSDPERDELTPEYVQRFADLNPDLQLESVTFRAMLDGDGDGIPFPEFPDFSEGGESDVRTDGGEALTTLDPEDLAAIPEDELERYRKRKGLFTCPDCGEVADARIDAPSVPFTLFKPWVEIHTVQVDGEDPEGRYQNYFHISEDDVDRGADLRTLAEKHAESDAEPDPRENPDEESPDDPDGYERVAYRRGDPRDPRESEPVPRTDGGEDRDPEACPDCGTTGEMYAPGQWGCPNCENTWADGEGLRTDGGEDVETPPEDPEDEVPDWPEPYLDDPKPLYIDFRTAPETVMIQDALAVARDPLVAAAAVRAWYDRQFSRRNSYMVFKNHLWDAQQRREEKADWRAEGVEFQFTENAEDRSRDCERCSTPIPHGGRIWHITIPPGREKEGRCTVCARAVANGAEDDGYSLNGPDPREHPPEVGDV